jgi:PKD repeat protein
MNRYHPRLGIFIVFITFTVFVSQGQAKVVNSAQIQGLNIIADAGSDREASVGEQVFFNASNSIHPDGGALHYHWDFGDGTTVADAVPLAAHSYSVADTYTVVLTVSDGEFEAKDVVTISIQEVE